MMIDKTPVDFKTINGYGMVYWNQGDPTLNFMISKIFKIIWNRVGQEIDIESLIDPLTKLDKDYKRIVFHPHKKRCLAN
jgi:hypothetical protein